MGTSKPVQNESGTRKDTDNVTATQKDKKPFKLTTVTKEELERRRIPVYSYIL